MAVRAKTGRLDGVVSFFKLGLWLIFRPKPPRAMSPT